MSEEQNPERASRRDRWLRVRRVLVWVGVALVGAVLLIIAAYHLDKATESKEFCGLLCHPNRPEYVTHEVSPHANVECGTCHVGPGLTPKITAKIYGVGELVSLVTNSYDRPIELPVDRLRPARDICQQCHWPGISDPDRLRLVETFAGDETNTASRISLTMRLGKGQTGGSGQGVHWHVANPIQYVATDRLNQQIVWVGATVGGQQVEYRQQGALLTAEQLAKLPRRDMDCLDCHNRATHVFAKPEEKLDEALASGRIDLGLPFVKREGLELLSASYPSQDEGVVAMVALADFYRSQYPDVLAAQQQAIDRAVAMLQEIYRQTVFPEMNLIWQSYPNNLGHADFPGCFRCHDGQHLNAQGEAIPANCTLCHSVPVVVRAGQELNLGLAGAPAAGVTQPDSHLKATFLADHRVLANESCVKCHGPIQYGMDNSSFCANGLCHGQEWPRLALRAGFVHPIQLIGQHTTVSCNACHQGVRKPSIEDCASCHQPPSTSHFGTECSRCHTPDGWAQSASRWVTGAPAIPHPVQADTDCLTCHGPTGQRPIPASHDGIPSVSCAYCHKGQAAARVSGPPIPHLVQGPETCQTCHGEGSLKPTSAIHTGIPAGSCLTCHQSVPLTDVPTVPHIVERRDTCLACHDQGKLKPEPINHQGWPNESCLLCHQAQPAATPVAASPAPAIPHLVTGLATCLTCHGQAPLKPVSSMHQGIPADAPADTCLACHKSVLLSDVPAISHATEAPDTCLNCHDQGKLKPAPANHQGWPKDACLLCHKAGPAAAPVVVAGPAIPHSVDGLTTCLTCHGQPPLKPVAAIHQGIPANAPSGTCLACHKSTPLANVPTISHTIQGLDACLTCHDQGKLKPVPANHQGWPGGSCLLCHQVQPGAAALVGSAVPHRIEGLTTCLACHGQPPLKPTSALHVGIPASAPSGMCLACHSSVRLTGAPKVPHGTQGREDCLRCHGEGGGEEDEARLPGNHKGWPRESCLLCHSGSGSSSDSDSDSD